MTEFSDRYRDVAARILSLSAGETDAIALMATMSCELFHSFGHFHWVGFYRNTGNEILKIGPYQGGHGCLVIPFSKGVCGAAARTRAVQLVPDVEAFEGHIACSTSTRSELVLPVFGAGAALLGVLDIDSDLPDAFDATDAADLEALLRAVFSTAD